MINRTFAKLDSKLYIRLILGRIVQAVLAVLGVSVLVWSLIPLASGDTAERVLKARGVENPTDVEIKAVREEFGLDRPLLAQYFAWSSKALTGDFSHSFQTKRPVIDELVERLPATVLLAAIALFMSLFFSISAALISAAYFEKPPDRLIRFLTQTSSAVPSFLLGLLILQFLVVGYGMGNVITEFSISGAIFPAFCLAWARFGTWTQILRTNLIEAGFSRYALVAKARGATDARILWRYALPNAVLPFLTVVGIGIGSLLGGAAIIETVFSWNGIGSRVVEAVVARDLPVIQGFVIFTTLIYIAANLAVDLLSLRIDPRLKAAEYQEKFI